MSMMRAAFCAGAVLLGAAAAVRSAEIDDAMGKLAAEAAKVGNIIWYESSPDDAADKIAAAFHKRFPNLKLEHVRDTGGNSIGGGIVQGSPRATPPAHVPPTPAPAMLPPPEAGPR